MNTRFSLGPIQRMNLRSRMGRYCHFPLLLAEEPTGLYFFADQHKDGSLHRVSLRGKQKFVAEIIKQMSAPGGIKFEGYDLSYIDGGPSWEWAGAQLASGILPVARNPGETLLSFMAQRFDSVVSGMLKTDGSPPLDGWATPIMAAWLIENGWPVSQPCKDAWKNTYEKWKVFIDTPVPTATQYEYYNGQKWAVEHDGTRRQAYNIEKIAVFPKDLYKPALFFALASNLDLEPATRKPRPQ